MLLTRVQANDTNTKLLHTQVPIFGVNNYRFNDFEHFLNNHLRPFSNKLTKEAKVQHLQSPLRKGAIQVFQSRSITTEMTLIDVFSNFPKQFTKDDLKEVARYKSDQAKNDPTTETFSHFLERLKVIAKQILKYRATKNPDHAEPFLILIFGSPCWALERRGCFFRRLVAFYNT